MVTQIANEVSVIDDPLHLKTIPNQSLRDQMFSAIKSQNDIFNVEHCVDWNGEKLTLGCVDQIGHLLEMRAVKRSVQEEMVWFGKIKKNEIAYPNNVVISIKKLAL